MHRIFNNDKIQDTILTLDKVLNSLIHGSSFCVIIYTTFKNVRFLLGHLVDNSMTTDFYSVSMIYVNYCNTSEHKKNVIDHMLHFNTTSALHKTTNRQLWWGSTGSLQWCDSVLSTACRVRWDSTREDECRSTPREHHHAVLQITQTSLTQLRIITQQTSCLLYVQRCCCHRVRTGRR